MPQCEVRIYQENPGDVPFLQFLDRRKQKEQAKVLAAVERLSAFGHELRPPHTEHLGNQLYYLRVKVQDGTCRIFYWPFGRGIIILGHGFSKKTAACPPAEIERAEAMRERYLEDPDAHVYTEERTDDDQDEE